MPHCQGFQKAFPSPQPYSSYVQVLEEEFHCAAFCDGGTPLFRAEGASEACKWPLARRLLLVAVAAGVTSLAVGVIVGIFSIALYNYEGL